MGETHFTMWHHIALFMVRTTSWCPGLVQGRYLATQRTTSTTYLEYLQRRKAIVARLEWSPADTELGWLGDIAAIRCTGKSQGPHLTRIAIRLPLVEMMPNSENMDAGYMTISRYSSLSSLPQLYWHAIAKISNHEFTPWCRPNFNEKGRGKMILINEMQKEVLERLSELLTFTGEETLGHERAINVWWAILSLLRNLYIAHWYWQNHTTSRKAYTWDLNPSCNDTCFSGGPQIPCSQHYDYLPRGSRSRYLHVTLPEWQATIAQNGPIPTVYGQCWIPSIWRSFAISKSTRALP